MNNLYLYLTDNVQQPICLDFASIDPKDTVALPLMLYFPFINNSLPYGVPLNNKLHAMQMALQSETPLDENELDWDFEIQKLTAQDISFLQDNSNISISATEAMPRIRIWLDKILICKPDWSYLGEIWFQSLTRLIHSLEQPTYFQLDIARLFASNMHFEQVMDARFADELNLLNNSRLEQATFILQKETLTQSWEKLHQDMLSQTLFLSKSKQFDDVLNISITDHENKKLHSLRMSVLAGDWRIFHHAVNPQNTRELALTTQAAAVASSKTTNKAVLEQIEQQRMELFLASDKTENHTYVFREQITKAKALRDQKLYADAVFQYEKTFALFIDPIHQTGLRAEYVTALLNLSYLYIILIDEPQKAFELLHPHIQIMDADEAWLKVHSNERSKIKANYENALGEMRSQGLVMPAYAPKGLSKQDGEYLSEQKNCWFDLIDQKAFSQALELSEAALLLLQDNQIPAHSYRTITWQLNKAQNLRQLERYNESVSLLTELIELINHTESMHAKQLLPRAQLNLALNAKRQGQIENAKNIYTQLIHSRLAHEAVNDIRIAVGDGCNNLALIYSEEKNFEKAAGYYQKAFEYILAAEQPVKASEKLWYAYSEAVLSKKWHVQNKIVDLFIDTFQDYSQEKIIMRLNKIKTAKIELERSNPEHQSAVSKFFSKWFKG